MSELKCEAITAAGVQCKRDAVEGSKFCALPKHAALEVFEDMALEPEIVYVNVANKNQYEIIVMSLGANDDPAVGIFSRESMTKRLQQSYDDGYEIAHVEKFDRVPKLGGVQEHFWVMFVLKLRK